MITWDQLIAPIGFVAFVACGVVLLWIQEKSIQRRRRIMRERYDRVTLQATVVSLRQQLAASQASVTQHACECARLQSDNADLHKIVAEYSARVSADDGRICDLEAALAECHREQIARIKPAGHDCNCAVFQQDSLLAICSCGRQNAAPLGIPAGDCGRGVSTLAGCSGEGDKQLFGG
jgi:hypothetical protein